MPADWRADPRVAEGRQRLADYLRTAYDKPMTAGLNNPALFATPDRVAYGIVRAIDRHRNVVHLSWFWAPLMCLMRAMPEPIFKRMRL